MKKTTKLLSVLLAVVMMLSCFTMGAFAARANYQTGANLDAPVNNNGGLNAYSPDGAVTRLSTEVRMSMIFDWLDTVLRNVNFTPIHNTTAVTLDIDIHSVDLICSSITSLKSALNSGLAGLGSFLGLLGDLGDLSLDTWTSGTTRDNTAQLKIIQMVIGILLENEGFINKVLTKGSLNAGSIIGGMLPMSKVNKILGDIPGLILSKIYPLMQRKDDTKSEADNMYAGYGFTSAQKGNPEAVLNQFVNNLFQKTQSTTTYKENASGTCISGHNLPTSSTDGKRYYYVKTAASGETPAYFTCYVYNPETTKYDPEEAKFYRTEESTGVYTYMTKAGDGLKYYKNGSYWLPSFVGQSISLTSDSASGLLYKFAPYVFADLAPIALNGFVKQALATWMGATETKKFEGKLADGTASDYYNSLPAEVKSFFSASIPYYQFSYSNYLAYSDDLQYYRYVDKDTNVEEWFELDMTTGNAYLGLFDFTYQVDGTFMNEFIPSSGTSSKTILQSLNAFLCKAASTILKDDVYTYLGLNAGDNSNLVANLRKVAQKLLPVGSVYGGQPDAILGPDYLVHYDGYYQVLYAPSSGTGSATDAQVFAALAAIIAKALMPQLILPAADQLYNVGVVLACVVRELVTQFVPTYNYDALIFSNYNTRTVLANKDNGYWLDVILTMGVDVGMSYLKELTDLGEDDTTNGFQWEESKTYALNTFESNPQAWEAKVDWIIDWALTNSKLWGWRMQNLVDVSGLTINLASAQDPWTKLDKILNDLLPLKQIINCSAASGKTWLETVLRDKLVLGIADLHFEYIVGKGTDYTQSGNAGLLSIPSTSVLRSSNVLKQLFVIVRDLLNKVVYKVAGNTNLFNTSTFTQLNDLVGKATFTDLTNTSRSNAPKLLQAIDVLENKLKRACYSTSEVYSGSGNNAVYGTGLLDTVLPIVNMFAGWKTSSQELADPSLVWSDSYILRTSDTNNGITLTITNSSSGMLLKRYKADGTSVYEAAYNLTIDTIAGTGLAVTKPSNQTAAPYGVLEYTIKASSVPTTDIARKLEITYHYSGKDGSAVGGTQYMSTYIVCSKNTNLVGSWEGEIEKTTKTLWVETNYVKVGVKQPYNMIVFDRNDLADLGDTIILSFENKHEDNDAKFTQVNYTQQNNGKYITNSTEMSSSGSFKVNTTLAKGGGALEVHPFVTVKDTTNNDFSHFTTGTSYATGPIKVKIQGGGQTTDEYTLDLGKVFFADMGDLKALYDQEKGKSRKAADYNVTSAQFTAYDNAMKTAAILCTGPVVESDSTTANNFANRYTASAISAATEALQTAVETLENNPGTVTGNEGVLNNGLTAGETAALIGADDQINFQDFELYGYWAYENVRTQARNILKEYERPTEPEQYIEDCWLPYSNGDKNEDLTHVLAGVTNTTKKNAIIASLKAPDAKAMQAYYEADAAYVYPTYSNLYVSDIAQKLDFYNDFLIPRSYSTEAAGRAQLAKEIAYANAQQYNANDYTDVSWARYQWAYNNATTINGRGTGAMQSYVFEAKYELLKAQRDLRLKAYDWATQNGYDELNNLVALANAMFDNASYFAASAASGIDTPTAWKNLIEALGYKATFQAGTDDEWSMNLYAKSAGQLLDEELDTRSGRNEERVAAVTAALAKAINDLECTIKVVSKDSTVVTEATKFITNIVPLSLTSAQDVLNHVRASDNSALTVTASAKGYGTGTTVSIMLGTTPLVNYYVVIYGDVDGDSAVDGFDAAKVDSNLTTGGSLGLAQDKAAEASGDDVFDVNDVSAIMLYATRGTGISQNH